MHINRPSGVFEYEFNGWKWTLILQDWYDPAWNVKRTPQRAYSKLPKEMPKEVIDIANQDEAYNQWWEDSSKRMMVQV